MRLAVTTILLAFVPITQAATVSCEATFARKGSPVTGLRYTAIQSVVELTTPDAISQLRGIVLGRGYDVLASEPDAGDMLVEMPQSMNRRSFQLIARATSEAGLATVQLEAQLRAGVFAKDDDVRAEMCAVLGELKGGQAGEAEASKGRNATAGGGAPTALTAQTLADRLSKERDKNPDEIPLRYKGRSFTLTGNVAQVRKDGDSYNVVFDIMGWEDKSIHLPGDSQFKTEIVCVLAPGQSVYALTLTPKGRAFKLSSSVKLTGTYADYREFPSPSVFWLSDCKPQK
jgi:hypothetical protein